MSETAFEDDRQFEQGILQCKLWGKLRAGDAHLVTLRDVREVFAVFNAEDSVKAEHLIRLTKVEALGVTEPDLFELIKVADPGGYGEVSIDAFLAAVTRGELAYHLIKQSVFGADKKYKSSECDLEELIAWMRHEYEVKSNLWDLPLTFALFMSFIASAAVHLDVEQSFKASRVFSYAMNYGDTLLYYQADWESFWAWTEIGMLRNMIRQNLITWIWYGDDVPVVDDFTTYPFLGRVNKEQQLLGGIRFRRRYTLPVPCDVSEKYRKYYDPVYGGQCRVGEELIEDTYFLYHIKIEILEEKIRNMSNSLYIDHNTTSLDFETFSFNANVGTFSFVQYRTEFETGGFFKSREGARETWLAAPYGKVENAVPDVLYVLLILSMFYGEMKELIPAVQNGLDAIKQYFKFWNCVDWISIIWGFTVFSIWVKVCLQISNDLPNIASKLPSDILDLYVFANQTYLTEADFDQAIGREEYTGIMEEIFTVASEIKDWHMYLRWVVTGYLFVLMFKFFKSFRANQRLDVVIITIKESSVDVAHFFMAFLLVHLSFAGAGMLLMGYTMNPYSTFLGAVFYLYRGFVGVGDIEVHDHYVGYQFLCYIWVLFNQLLMQILMINILIGLIFEAYGRVNAAPGSRVTLAEQIGEAVLTLKDTKHDLDMYYLICELEDEDFPAHPQKLVTVRSLRKAFQKDKMTKTNAEYLIVRASEYAETLNGRKQLNLEDGIRMIGQTKVAANKVMVLCETISRMLKVDRTRLYATGVLKREEAVSGVQLAQSSSSSSSSSKTRVRSSNGQPQGEKQLREDLLLAKARQIVGKFEDIRNNRAVMLESLSRAIDSHNKDADQHSEWTLQHNKVLTDRCEKIELGIGKLSECLRGVNSDLLQEVPERLHDMATRLRKLRQGTNNQGQVNESAAAILVNSLAQDLNKINDDVKQIAGALGGKVNVRLALRQVETAVKELEPPPASMDDDKAGN